jgi:diguanylate cyclase (GGDEF)-like protein
VILLPDTDSEGARILAENLRKMIEVHTFSADISLTCSFGVAAKKQDDVYLFRKADEALYRAKLNGRNRVVIY